MIKIYKKINRNLEEIQAIEKDCWINISPPFDFDRLEKLSEQLNIPYDFLILVVWFKYFLAILI